jgi:hypothetical protein
VDPTDHSIEWTLDWKKKIVTRNRMIFSTITRKERSSSDTELTESNYKLLVLLCIIMESGRKSTINVVCD